MREERLALEEVSTSSSDDRRTSNAKLRFRMAIEGASSGEVEEEEWREEEEEGILVKKTASASPLDALDIICSALETERGSMEQKGRLQSTRGKAEL